MTGAGLLADLRAEHLRLRFTLLRIEIIGIALSRGILDLETALDMYANLPKLRSEPPPYTADFLSEVMSDDPPWKTFRSVV